MLCQQRYVVVYVRVRNSCCSASAEFVKEETYKLQIAKGIGCLVPLILLWLYIL